MRIALSFLALLTAAPLAAQSTTPSDVQGASAATSAAGVISHTPKIDPCAIQSAPPPGAPSVSMNCSNTLPTVPAMPTPLTPPGPGIVRVRMTTSQGAILIDLEQAKAPLTVANFLKYVDGKRFDASTVYRVVKAARGFGFIQGGIQNDPKKILPAVAHEPTSKTGLSHLDGTISLPRSAPGTGHGEFFIVVGDIPSMDADPKQPGDNLGYAAFGHVVQGMEIVRHVMEEPVSATKGFAGMKGQMLDVPVKILSVRRVTN